MIYFIITINFIIIIGLLYIAHKARRIHLKTYQVQRELESAFDVGLSYQYQQFQALLTLENTLDLNRFLPPLRGWAASPDLLVNIMKLALEQKPENIVECGSGASTLVLAKCAEMNDKGHIYSLEHDPVYGQKQRQMLINAKLDHRVTIVDAPLIEHNIKGEVWKWYDFSALGYLKIDVLIVDGPPMSTGPLARYPAGPLLFSKLTDTGTVILDDMIRDDEQEGLSIWQKDDPSLKAEDKYCEKGCIFLTRE